MGFALQSNCCTYASVYHCTSFFILFFVQSPTQEIGLFQKSNKRAPRNRYVQRPAVCVRSRTRPMRSGSSRSLGRAQPPHSDRFFACATWHAVIAVQPVFAAADAAFSKIWNRVSTYLLRESSFLNSRVNWAFAVWRGAEKSMLGQAGWRSSQPERFPRTSISPMGNMTNHRECRRGCIGEAIGSNHSSPR